MPLKFHKTETKLKDNKICGKHGCGINPDPYPIRKIIRSYQIEYKDDHELLVMGTDKDHNTTAILYDADTMDILKVIDHKSPADFTALAKSLTPSSKRYNEMGDLGKARTVYQYLNEFG